MPVAFLDGRVMCPYFKDGEMMKKDDLTLKAAGMKKRPVSERRSFYKRGLFNARGFTLTELMVGVSIIMITAAIAVPMYISDLPRQKTKAAAKNMASDIRLARARAVADNTDYVVCLNDVNKVYTILPGPAATAIGDCNGLPDWNSVDTRIRKEVDLNKNHRGVHFGVGTIGANCPTTNAADPILFPGNVIRFNTRGSSVDGGGNVLLSRALYLTNPEDKKKTTFCLHVEGTTGRTRLYEWRNGQWN